MYYTIPYLNSQINKFRNVPKWEMLNMININDLKQNDYINLCSNTNAMQFLRKLSDNLKYKIIPQNIYTLSRNINMLKLIKLSKKYNIMHDIRLIYSKNASKIVKLNTLNKWCVVEICKIQNIDLIKKIIRDPELFTLIDRFEFCKNPAFIKIIKKMLLTHPQFINWPGLCQNPKAINIIKREFINNRFKNINIDHLLLNYNAIDIIKYILQNYPHITLPINKHNYGTYIDDSILFKLSKIMQIDHYINWWKLSREFHTFDILNELYETDINKIDWNCVNNNPNIIEKNKLLRMELINSKNEKRRCLLFNSIIYENECLFDLINFDNVKLSEANYISLCKNPKAINLIINKIELDKINNKKCEIKYNNLLKYPHVFRNNKKIYKNNINRFY